jgi:hypothetical protein
MAQISLEELIKVVKEHPQYKKKWDLEVSADIAFCITFGKKEQSTLIRSINYDLPSGLHLVVDLGNDNKVYSIEFA